HRNTHHHQEAEDALGTAERRTLTSVFAVQTNCRKSLRTGGNKRVLSGLDSLFCSAKIGARIVGNLQGFLQAPGIEIGIRQAIGEIERLSERESDGARQIELADGQVVPSDCEIELLGV